ncbi:hypothetical protein LZ30DRAFT_405847 [Colletotrichum cereale]|nr:hypothetical protein LZ30DRAFT_405847 [Colletotrichum cereale]
MRPFHVLLGRSRRRRRQAVSCRGTSQRGFSCTCPMALGAHLLPNGTGSTRWLPGLGAFVVMSADDGRFCRPESARTFFSLLGGKFQASASLFGKISRPIVGAQPSTVVHRRTGCRSRNLLFPRFFFGFGIGSVCPNKKHPLFPFTARLLTEFCDETLALLPVLQAYGCSATLVSFLLRQVSGGGF